MRTKGLMVAALLAAGMGTAYADEPPKSGLPEACRAASSGEGMMNHAMPEMGGTMDHSADRSSQEAMAGMQRMNADMALAMRIADPDIAFVCGMIAHHQGAIAMSETELKQGKDEWVRRMARQIIGAQMREIEQMTRWVEEKSAK